MPLQSQHQNVPPEWSSPAPNDPYTRDDIKILHEIVSLAAHRNQNPKFAQVFKAYNTVISAHGIPQDNDSIYFRTIFRIKYAEGRDIFEKLQNVLHEYGVDEEETRILETPAEITEYTKDRYAKVRERREKSLLGSSTGDEDYVPESSSEAIESEDGLSSSYESTQSIDYEAEDEKDPRRKGKGVTRRPRLYQELAKTQREAQSRRKRQRQEPQLIDHAVQTSTPVYSEDSLTDDNSLINAANQLRLEQFDDQIFQHADDSEYCHELQRSWLQWQSREQMKDNIRLRRAITKWSERLAGNQSIARDASRAYREKLIWDRTIVPWHAALQRRRELDEELEARCENFLDRKDKHLLLMAFSHWCTKTKAVQMRTQETAYKLLLKKYLARWRFLTERTLLEEEEIQRFQIRKALRKWQEGMHRFDGAIVQAQNCRQTAIKRSAMNEWYQAYNGRIAAQHHGKQVLKKYMAVWEERMQAIQGADQVANMFVFQTLAGGAWDQWSKRTDELKLAQDDAEDHYEWKLLFGVLGRWRTAAKYAPGMKRIQEIGRFRTEFNFFTIWRNRVRNLRIAQKCYDTNLLRRFVKSWRYRAAESQVVRNSNRRLAVDTLYDWILNHRCKLFTGVRDGQLARQVLQVWQERTHEKEAQIGNNLVIFEMNRNARYVNKAMDVLADKYHKLKTMQAQAERHFLLQTLQRALGKWKARHEHIKHEMTRSVIAEEYFARRKCVRAWKRNYKEHKKHNLRSVFIDYTKKRKRNLVQKIFQQWNERTLVRQELNERAANFVRDRAVRTALVITNSWHAMTIEILEQARNAEYHYQQHLAKKALLHLRARLEHLEELEAQAEEFFARRVGRTATKILRTWKIQNSRHIMNHKAATEYRSKRPKTVAQRVLKHWRVMAQQRLEQRQAPTMMPGFADTTNVWTNQTVLASRTVMETPRWNDSPRKLERRWARTIGTARTTAWNSTTPLGMPGPSRLAPITAGWGATPMGSPMRRIGGTPQQDILMEEDEERTENGQEHEGNDMPSDSGLGSVGGLGSVNSKGYGG